MPIISQSSQNLTRPQRLRQDVSELLLGARIIHTDPPAVHVVTNEMKFDVNVLTAIM